MDGTEIVYTSEQDYNHIDTSSEPVQGLATRVYTEFEHMIAKYDQDSVRNLMPLVVTMLETLDQAIKEKNESLVEIELLEEDKKQLKSQYERERHGKREAERRLMESEDTVESISQELNESRVKLDITCRQLDMKTKSHNEQVERLQDREADLKQEYLDLHQRHSEMIRSYVEHIEKTKSLQQQLTPDYSSYSPVVRKTKAEIIEDFTPLSSQTLSNQSVTSTPLDSSVEEEDVNKSRHTEWESANHHFQPCVEQEISEAMWLQEKKKDSVDIHSDGVSVESVSSSGTDSAQVLCNEFQQNVLNLGCPTDTSSPNGAYNTLAKNKPSKLEVGNYGITNEGFEHVNMNNTSLFAELNGKGLGDVDEGADVLGMVKELENLVMENTKLMATKNALDIVKDDLIHQVDRLTGQLTMLQEDLDRSHQAKDLLSKRALELENQLKEVERQAKESGELSPSTQTTKMSDDDDGIPMSQRKRFTRVEMARVLMERNQYKERLMELQEAVRWTEMLRASRDHPAEAEVLHRPKERPKSSFSQFFSRLFGPSSSTSTNSSSRSRTQGMNPSSDDAKMRHSKSDSFTTSQSANGK